ncbi:hypothetical protein [Stakelama tenebrarum]|uniref:Uncharacterized protein n=1 Tax=Stakelama tenebrarum TaxID=2711215 RepID=A0A6G6Y839_9SPHN|nr:hypothetical protein [Sphingosinithalassobacter tenebrarum]QIG81079.1 hypothetical protein G5C33_15670 [Sphingosinithalassobacter tenebrarum]
MTLTLLLGGIVWFAIACTLVWFGSAGSGLRRVIGIVLALLGPVMGIAMFYFALAEGAASAGAPDASGRRAGQTRIVLLEADIQRSEGSQTLSMGGDPATDDIVLDGFPPAVAIVKEVDGTTRVSVKERAAEEPAVALFAGNNRILPGNSLAVPKTVTLRFATVEDGNDIPAEIDDLPTTHLSLSVSRTEKRWNIAFLDPEAEYTSGGNVQPASADLEHQPREGDNVVAFGMLGGTFAPLLEHVELVLPQEAGLHTYVSGNSPGYKDNQRIEVREGGLGIVLRVDPLNLTSGLRGYAGQVASLILVASMIVTWRVRRDVPLAAMLLATAEVLLSLRIIVAMEGGLVDETVRSRAALGDALVALPLGLLALSAAIGSIKRLPIQGVVFGGSAICVMLLIKAVHHDIPETSWQVVKLLMALTLLAITIRYSLIPRGYRLARRLLEQAKKRAPAAWRARLASLRNGRVSLIIRDWVARTRALPLLHWLRRQWWLPILVAYAFGVALVSLRIILAELGMQERISAGQSSSGALSIGFVPLTLLAATPLLLLLSRVKERRHIFFCGIAFLVFLALFVLLLNYRVGDSGLGIVLMVSLALAGAGGRLERTPAVGRNAWLTITLTAFALAYGMSGYLAGNSGWWIIPLLLLLGAVGLQLWVRSWDSACSIPWLLPAATLSAIILLTSFPQLRPEMSSPPGNVEAMSGSSVPELRLMAALAPERLAFQAGQSADDIRETFGHLSYYIDDWDGHGMLNFPQPPPGLKKQQFSDYALALHVVSPFGRFAAIGLLLMLAGLAALAFSRVQENRGEIWFGALAITAFAGTSAYIALANLLQAPFTGRNFYLLAVQSSSDLAEGLLLLILGAVTLAAVDTEVRDE